MCVPACVSECVCVRACVCMERDIPQHSIILMELTCGRDCSA